MKSKTLLKIGTKATKILNRSKLVLQKKSPEILLGVGIACFVGTVVLACKATLKADTILEHHEEKMKDIEAAKEIAEVDNSYAYDEELYSRDKTVQKLKTTGEFIKLYAPAAALGVISVTCILTSRNILNKRYLAAVSAYNALSEVFQTYRKRVVDEYGEKMDQHFRYGTTYSTITETEVDEDGKKRKKKVDVEDTPKQEGTCDDCIFFDEHNPNWDRNPKFNLMFLRAQQNYLNDRLHTVGHVFMNEVYDSLGFPHTQTGALIGWVDGLGDSFIDFGLYDQYKDNVRKFVNGEDNTILLEFNHDGIIWDKI